MSCKHCDKPIFQPSTDGVWYHDDREGTLRCFSPETGRWRKAKPEPSVSEPESGEQSK